jgi:hypothetical protein
MTMFSRVIQSLVYAGIVSNMIAMGVCILCQDWGYTVSKLMSLTLWIFVYKIHRNNGTF